MGLFRNVEGYFIIDSDKYRAKNETGDYVLTDFAKKDLKICALQFAYPSIDIDDSNKETGILYKERKARPPERIFQPDYNEATIKKALSEVELFYNQYMADLDFDSETPAQAITRLMNKAKWKSSTFQQKTGLEQGIYRNILNNPDKKFELPTLVSICVGLDLTQKISTRIIEKAGYSLTGNIINAAYNYILSNSIFKDIPACNAFIEDMNKRYGSKVPLLGSRFYREKV